MSTAQLLRLYRFTRRVRRFINLRLVEGVGLMFDAFWLGILDRHRMHALDEAFYDERRESTDQGSLTYFEDEFTLTGLRDWETAAIDRHFPPGGKVIVTAAGAGREVLALLERGFDVHGFEPHPGFVAAGGDHLARHGFPDRIHQAQRDSFPEQVTCDAVVVGWGSYMLISPRWRRIEFLQAARRSLAPGAPLLASFYAHPSRTRYLRLVAALANSIRLLRRADRAEPGDVVGENFVHWFTPDEIEAELGSAGFELVDLHLEPYPHAVARAAEATVGAPDR